MPPSIFSFPNRIVFGDGTINTLADRLSEFSPHKVLLVTDEGIRRVGLAAEVTTRLEAAQIDYAVFDGVHSNPVEEDVADGVAVFQQEGCDFVIGMGGGSSLDVAKLICLKATHQLPLPEYEALSGGINKITSNLPSMLAIPTTAGTGSEVGRGAVVTLKSLDRKALVFSPHLLPKVAIADPTLTVGLPKGLTAATGMDALTHNIEAYLSTIYHPICDAIALAGTKLVANNLRCAVENGGDLKARGNMMIAAMMGAIAFQKELGVAHSLAHPLSTVAGVHHGLANAIVLPYTMAFNRDAARARLRDIAAAFGVNVHALTAEEGAEAAIDQVTQLCRDIGIPANLRAVNVTEEMIPVLAKKAMADGCHRTNPRPCTEGDMIDLYWQAM
ncbi:MAG: iron-containing alcohol dehydrogenase [Candidatus Poribacteria bacterium]|nr:iron-containing alcohol dehydrogenase [Candidatus Poribacteria bacterium]